MRRVDWKGSTDLAGYRRSMPLLYERYGAKKPPLLVRILRAFGYFVGVD